MRFTLDGLDALFNRPFTSGDEAFVRRIMRMMTLSNYLQKGVNYSDRAWCYWSRNTFAVWSQEGGAFTNVSSRTFTIDPSPFRNLKAPTGLTLPKTELFHLNTLYMIERSMVNGLRKLTNLLQSIDRIKPRDLEKALGDFGSALKSYDSVDEGENTVFAVLDQLIQRVGAVKRNSSFTLTAKVGDQQVKQALIA